MAIERHHRSLLLASSIVVVALVLVAGMVDAARPVRERLRVERGRLVAGRQATFLNGVNQAWQDYANDFGNDPPASDSQALYTTLTQIQQCGGNAVRMWVHCGAENTPLFNSSGFVIATDGANSLLSDMKEYLLQAQKAGVYVFFVLWNGAVTPTENMLGLVTSPAKLQSYIDVVLAPMVKMFASIPSLGGFEIMNEPEGLFSIADDPNPCFNTTGLRNTGAGWVGLTPSIAVQDILRFINLQSAVIHAIDPLAIVTIGSWSEMSQTDQFGYFNYYKDECLQAAGGQVYGVLNLNQYHAYAVPSYSSTSPFNHSASDYRMPNPIVVGEFSQDEGAGWTSPQQYTYVHRHGYAGAWGWQANGSGVGADNMTTLMSGMSSIGREHMMHTRPPLKPFSLN